MIQSNLPSESEPRARSPREIITARLGARYADFRLSDWKFSSNPDERHRQEIVLEWLRTTGKVTDDPQVPPEIDGFLKNLVFLGPCGTGKDAILAWLLRLAVQSGRSFEFFTGANLFGRIRDRISDQEVEQDFLDRLTAADVVALSDPIAVAGGLAPHQLAWLYRIVDERYRRRRPTWVTINAQDHRHAAELLTEKIWQRMTDDGVLLHFCWESFRAPLEVVGQ